MFESGFLEVGTLRGIPIRVHFTAALGALFFGGFRFAPGAWLGFLVLVVAHELGHAALVRWRRHEVIGVLVHGFGGECRYAGRVTPLDRAIIAWGGVLAQAGVLALALVGSLAMSVTSSFGRDLLFAFTTANLWLGGLNLLPFRPLDGAEAWKLPGLVRRGRGGPKKRPQKRAPRSADVEREARRIARRALDEARTRRED